MQSLWQLDQSLFRTVQSWRQPWLDDVFLAITSTGLGWVQVLLILIVLADFRSFREPAKVLGWRGSSLLERTSLAIPLLLSYALSGAINQGIKQLIERERPSNFLWTNALEDIHFNSYVSGHTATSFGIAATLFWLTRGTRYSMAGILGWVWALLVGVSRVYVGVHWPTDVLGGAAVGIVCGTWIAWLCRTPQKSELE